MKQLLLTAMLLATLAGQAQKIKTVDISRNNGATLICRYIYDTDTNVNIVLLGQDNRYQQLIEFIVIYSGTISETIDFFNDVEKIVTENEPDTWLQLGDQDISINRNYFSIYDFRGSNGYHGFTLKQWQRLKKDLNNYVLVNEL